MLSILVIFLCASIVSFVGSLQLGPVNFYVMNTSINHNVSLAFYVAIGGVLPEFIYSSIAVFFGSYISISPLLEYWFKVFMVVVFSVFAIYFWFKKSKSFIHEENNLNIKVKRNYLVKGFLLASFNFQLLPFWFTIYLFFNSNNSLKIKTLWHKLAYIFGAGVGAFILLALLIFAVNKHKNKLLKYIQTNNFNKVLAIVFFLIAVFQYFNII